ncbi:MAG: hypothetical protein AMJ55_00345 [Gammaproteobacteria bacterium SG8_15]|nr:MAG: hypothetical protein AMJ55_00345 [Gammaproteobacteria bacterium SG8_15]
MLRREDIDRFYDFNIHVPTRTLFMGTETDEIMAESVIKGLAMLSTNDQPIKILMNNLGGDEYHCLAIYDAIASCKAHVTIVAYGHAMSAGSWILQSADDRVLSPNATVMIHYGNWGYEDHVKYFRVLNKEMERLNTIMEETYLERIRAVNPKFSARRLKKMLEDEVYLSAQDAVELGLADRILK